ncbi:hypothetical protein [Salinispora pacifica]|nr:hypothetical protein [Salinispora pacifica]
MSPTGTADPISTTLDRYTHAFEAGADHVRESFADFPLTSDENDHQEGG